MSELEQLHQRIQQHERELERTSASHTQERREMRGYFDKLNENLIHLTTAVTEWKAKDSMYEQRIANNEQEIKELRSKQHEQELRVVKLEGATGSNTSILDKYQAFWLKVIGTIVVFAILGGLAYNLGVGK